MKIKEIWKNYRLCKLHPALKLDIFYRNTYLDLVPKGWQTLVTSLLDEIESVCGEDVYRKYSFADIKEKWYELDIIHNSINEEDLSNLFTEEEEKKIIDIENKFINISRQVCANCGRSLRDKEVYICSECKEY